MKNQGDSTGRVCADPTPEFKRLYGECCDMLNVCSLDEIRVHHRALSRSKQAREQYGSLDLAADPRNWKAEAADEHCDALFYMCAHEVAQDEKRKSRIASFIADEVRPGEVEDREVASRERKECEAADKVLGAFRPEEW